MRNGKLIEIQKRVNGDITTCYLMIKCNQRYNCTGKSPTSWRNFAGKDDQFPSIRQYLSFPTLIIQYFE